MSQTAPPRIVDAQSGVPHGEVGAVAPEALSAAESDAQQACARAEVEVVTPEEEAATRIIADLGDQVWGPGGTFARNELRALMHAGDPVHLALDKTQAGHPVVGFAVGFLGWSPVLHVHSHQVGVLPGHRRRGVGLALKLAQRHTCLGHGITDMRWTFDPLVRRNVTFNLRALGATAVHFYENFYGAMEDVINEGDASDRLEAIWALERPLPTARQELTAGSVAAPGPFVLIMRDGRPELTGVDLCPGAVMAVPADYESLRRDDRSLSRAWRAASREVLRAAYSKGLRIGRVTDAGYQLVDTEEA
jgi:predicted GNAT superfamily acetyltransferase